MSTSSKQGYPTEVKQFLKQYYEGWGVGRTVGQRLNHWRMQAKIADRTGETFEPENLSALEVTNLLADNFPAHWPSH